MGGLSPQREVSLAAGRTVHATLLEKGYDAVQVFVDRDLDLVLRQMNVEVAFNALSGPYGEDGRVQGMLELMGIPYTGSGPMASALANDKVRAKEVLRLYNLPTLPSYVLTSEDQDRVETVHGTFGYPCVVKPVHGAGALGMSMVTGPEELQAACELALRFDDQVMIERYVSGIEMTVAVLDGQALGALEIVPEGPLYDYLSKHVGQRVEFHCPARLSPGRYQGVLTQAVQAYRAVGCKGLTLVDIILTESGNEFILELDTQPPLTPASPVLKLAHYQGMDLAGILESMLDEALADGPQTARLLGDRRVRQVSFEGDDRRAVSLAKPQ